MLLRNIRSVIAQTYRNYEHIIVDDANESIIERLVKSFNDDRIVIYKHEHQKGAAAAYNTGISKSRGEFITFLDDDDEYFPSFLEKMNRAFFSTDRNTGFIWTGIERIEDTESGEKKIKRLTWPSVFALKEDAMIASSSIGNGFGLCIRNECINRIGLFDEDLQVGSDTDFMIRLAKEHNCNTIPEVLVRIHLHGIDQLTGCTRNLERIRVREILFEKYRDIFDMYPNMHIAHLFSFAMLCYSSGQSLKGRRVMYNLIRKNPGKIRSYCELISLELTNKAISETIAGKSLKKLVN